ncbi:MAG: S8/S53 family peptidase [Chlorobiaceae bacterium]|nr:S8/S53 family peptidase [Chlorobiaceae bacterium]NTV61540.1 S8/S53 family peptidase [Chlorobiaceae bacterium]
MSEIASISGAGRVLELESSGSAKKIVDAYDEKRGAWSFRFDSSFWKGVRHAHRLGNLGRGCKVAIIDSGCDTKRKQLWKHVDLVRSFVNESPEQDPAMHGTAVAMLINEVAPECRLDIYQVCRNGVPDEGALLDAIEAASETNAQVINLSMSVLSPFNCSIEQLKQALTNDGGSLKKFAREEPPCRLCEAASGAAAAGKLFFAAAGNKNAMTSCPAHADGVIAVGFSGSTEKTITDEKDGGSHSAAFAALPGASQAAIIDISLKEIDGVLGTSFASPLYSGVGALGLSRADLDAYISAVNASSLPQLVHGMIAAGQLSPEKDVIESNSRLYRHAMSMLPHNHCAHQLSLNPKISVTDPLLCFSCGLFAEPLMVNYGLWLLITGQLEEAKSILGAARSIAPWSADAAANSGAAMRVSGDIPSAVDFYETALSLRPGFEVYLSELRCLRGGEKENGRPDWWHRFLKRS